VTLHADEPPISCFKNVRKLKKPFFQEKDAK
jgi:hypothetical protein